MTHDHLRMLLPRYAAGALGPEQVTTVQTHLATGCTSCLNDLFRLPVGVPRETAPPSLTAANLVVPRLTESSRPNDRGRRPPLSLSRGGALAATAGLALIASSIAIWRDNVRRDRNQLRSTLDLLATERTAIREILADLHTTPGIQSVALAAPSSPVGAQGLALWSPGHPGIVLLINGLPTPGPTAGYRVTVAYGSGRNAAHFSVSARGDAVVPMRLTPPPSRLQRVEISDDDTSTTYLASTLRTDINAPDPRTGPPLAAAGTPARR